MLSPSLQQSSSLKSLTDSQINTDMSDLQQNQQKHQQTVRRFSILSGIQDELNKKLDQKPLPIINSIIVEEDEEQSIRKSRGDEEIRGELRGAVGIVSEYGVGVVEKSPSQQKEYQGSNGYRYKSQNYNPNPLYPQYQSSNLYKPHHHQQHHTTKQLSSKPLQPQQQLQQQQPRMYKIHKTINLLQPAPPIIHHPKAFYKQPVEDSAQQLSLFEAALITQRKQFYEMNNKI